MSVPGQIITEISQDRLLQIFVIIMLVFFVVDLLSYKNGEERHLDCKSILTSIGILGTFMGIFKGLINFDTSNIQDSIPDLLNGLKFAFVLSILGLMLAVLLHLFQTWPELARTKTRNLAKAAAADYQQQIAQNTANLAEVLNQQSQIIDHQQQLIQYSATIAELTKEIAERTYLISRYAPTLNTTQDLLAQIRLDLYEDRRRFSKVGPERKLLSPQARDWQAIKDHATDLVWEYKTDSGLHDKTRRFTWEEVEQFIDSTDSERLAGFYGWRLPTINELRSLSENNSIPDPRFFGNLVDPENTQALIMSSDLDSEDQPLAVWLNRNEYRHVRKAYLVLVCETRTKAREGIVAVERSEEAVTVERPRPAEG